MQLHAEPIASINKVELQGTLNIIDRTPHQPGPRQVPMLLCHIHTGRVASLHRVQIVGPLVAAVLRAEDLALRRKVSVQAHLRGRLWSSRQPFIETQAIEFFWHAGQVHGLNHIELQGEFFCAEFDREPLRATIKTISIAGGTHQVEILGKDTKKVVRAAQSQRALNVHATGSISSAPHAVIARVTYLEFFGLPDK
jgi:hypothetical protein